MNIQELEQLYNDEATKAEYKLELYNNQRGNYEAPCAPTVNIRNLGRKGGYYSHNGEIDLNSQLVDYPEAALNTIRHELAHWMQYEIWSRAGFPRRVGRWRSHGLVWSSFASMLGCNGNRCHSLPLQATRKQARWLYILADGSECILTTTRHNKLQRGKQTYRMVSTNQPIRKEHFQGPAK